MSVKIEHLVVISIPRVNPPGLDQIDLTREQARELYDALHAEFGDFDQARELSQLARESVARELRLAKLEAKIDLGRGYTAYVPVVAETGPFGAGPTLQDDIERMVAAHDVVHASGTVDDAEDRGTTEGNP